MLGVIPARLGSSRLPGKPLRPIRGRPLIEWVWRRAAELDALDELVVATDSLEVVGAVERFGGRAILTGVRHRSGTERVAEAAARREYARFDWIVNLQGDELFAPPDAARAALECVWDGWDVGTVCVPLADGSGWRDPSVVKVVRDDRGGALYFSRAPIPYDVGRGAGPAHGARAASGERPPEADHAPALRHVGVYAFGRETLRRAVSLPPHPLERRERLEQLRWLAAGLRIGVAVVEGGGPGVDTEADVTRAERILGGKVPDE